MEKIARQTLFVRMTHSSSFFCCCLPPSPVSISLLSFPFSRRGQEAKVLFGLIHVSATEGSHQSFDLFFTLSNVDY